MVHLLSYRPVERTYDHVNLVDLTRVTSVPKFRFAYWGWWVRRYVQQLQPDVLHAHQIQGAGWLGAMSGYHPFVVSGWGSDILLEQHKSLLRWLLVRVVRQQCDELTVPSQLLYDKAKEIGFSAPHIHLIPWGIDTEIFRPTPRDAVMSRRLLGIDVDARVILCPRKISPLYNIHTVLEAVGSLSTQLSKLQLVLLNFDVDSRYRLRLQRMISGRKMEDLVVWLPAQKSASDMARLYRMADVTVSIPSSEGYGSSVYEAMATGCPTVISDLPVFEDELQNRRHTLKVPVGDAEGTSQALEVLLTDEELRQELIRNARHVCQEKSIEERISRSNALYRRLAS